MIILKVVEENKNFKKSNRLRRKKTREPVFDYSRAGIIINNKPHFIISVSKNTIEDYEFQKMLNKYKGSILVPESLEDEPMLNDLLFDKSNFLKKAIFENFRIMLSTGNYRDANVLIKDKDFVLECQIPTLLPYVKSVSVFLNESKNIRMWQENCFNEYGIKPNVYHSERADYLKFDIVADFEKIKNNSLQITSFNEPQKIFPNFKYLEIPEKLKVLEDIGLSKAMICAAFKE